MNLLRSRFIIWLWSGIWKHFIMNDEKVVEVTGWHSAITERAGVRGNKIIVRLLPWRF